MNLHFLSQVCTVQLHLCSHCLSYSFSHICWRWTPLHPQADRLAKLLQKEPLCQEAISMRSGGIITQHMINSGPLSARSVGEGDSMPRGINRQASQTGTWPPFCMLDRRSCVCELWEMKGFDLEKFKGRVSPPSTPTSFLPCLLYLPISLSLPLSNFFHFASLLLLFVVIFHTRPY